MQAAAIVGRDVTRQTLLAAEREVNHVVVVKGSEKVYEDLCWLNAAPPTDTARQRATVRP